MLKRKMSGVTVVLSWAFAPVMAAAILFYGCSSSAESGHPTSFSYARYVDVLSSDGNVEETGGSVTVVSVSPFDGSADTMLIDSPVKNVVCMSSSHTACLSAVGCDTVICAVSGVRYLSDTVLLSRYAWTCGQSVRDAVGFGPDVQHAVKYLNGDGMDDSAQFRPLYDIGHDAAFDYERILALHPDMVVAYAVSPALPQYVSRLRSLGVPVLVLYDNFEAHPLARAEYVRLFGAIAGVPRRADSVFSEVSRRYEALSSFISKEIAGNGLRRKNVLLNVPYRDVWYIPGEDNYMSRLVSDAGGKVLGAKPGRTESSSVTVERAYELSLEADFWLNAGACVTRSRLESLNPMFILFPPLKSAGHTVYNNVKRSTPGGGNDFWESGAVRPDLILEDLIRILHYDGDGDLHYYVELE